MVNIEINNNKFDWIADLQLKPETDQSTQLKVVRLVAIISSVIWI